jgi:hypothetical protein
MGLKVPITSGFMIVLDDQQFARAFFVDRVYSRVSTYFSVALKSKDVFFPFDKESIIKTQGYNRSDLIISGS